MKIRALSVDRFGPISELRLDDLPDRLGVLYVPSGAGRDALMRFVQCVLFGCADDECPPAHTKAGPRVGGRVLFTEADGDYTIERHFDGGDEVRVTRPDGALGGADDLRRLLAGVDATRFGAVFTLGPAAGELPGWLDVGRLRSCAESTAPTNPAALMRAALEEIDAECSMFLGASGSGRIDALVTGLNQLRSRLDEARRRVVDYGELRLELLRGTTELARLTHDLARQRASQQRLGGSPAEAEEGRDWQRRRWAAEEAEQKALNALVAANLRQDEVRRELADTRGRLPGSAPPTTAQLAELARVLVLLRAKLSEPGRGQDLETARLVAARRNEPGPSSPLDEHPEMPWWTVFAALLALPVAAFLFVKGGRYDASTVLLMLVVAVVAAANGVTQLRGWRAKRDQVREACRRTLRAEIEAARQARVPQQPDNEWIGEVREMSALLGLPVCPSDDEIERREAEFTRQQAERQTWDTVQMQMAALTWSLREMQEREVNLRAALSAARQELAVATAGWLACKAADPQAARGMPEGAPHDDAPPAAQTAEDQEALGRRIEGTEREIALVGERCRLAQQACRDLEESSDIPTLENEWSASMAELEIAVRRWRVLAITRGLIEESTAPPDDSELSAVLSEASRLFLRASAGRYREIVLTEGGTGLALVDQAGGLNHVPDDLGASAVQQLRLCLFLSVAMREAGLSGPLPILVDEALTPLDPQEAHAVAELLAEVSSHQQVLYFTSDPATRDLLLATGVNGTAGL